MRDDEIITQIRALRDEMYRQMAQFERDKVAAEDERARGAIKGLIDQVTQIQDDLTALAVRVALCEGRITRLEAKP